MFEMFADLTLVERLVVAWLMVAVAAVAAITRP